jgi:hypothetical protein
MMQIQDLGWNKFGSGMEKIRIWDKHPGCETLLVGTVCSKKEKNIVQV